MMALDSVALAVEIAILSPSEYLSEDSHGTDCEATDRSPVQFARDDKTVIPGEKESDSDTYSNYCIL